MISPCGVNCATDCKAFKVDCEGCNRLLGKIPWAQFYGTDLCPIYACVQRQGLVNCAKCGKAPCNIWYETRNPDASDEEFAADIASRLINLGKE